MVVAGFGSGCRGSELCSIRISDLHFTTDGTDTDVGPFLYGVKAKKEKETVRLVIFGNWKETAVINPALAVLIQLAVVHGVDNLSQKAIEGPLFPSIYRNQILFGRHMSSDVYSSNVRCLFLEPE